MTDSTDKTISKLYTSSQDEESPVHIDNVILAAAHKAANEKSTTNVIDITKSKKTNKRNLMQYFAVAAVLVLGISITLQMGLETEEDFEMSYDVEPAIVMNSDPVLSSRSVLKAAPEKNITNSFMLEIIGQGQFEKVNYKIVNQKLIFNHTEIKLNNKQMSSIYNMVNKIDWNAPHRLKLFALNDSVKPQALVESSIDSQGRVELVFKKSDGVTLKTNCDQCSENINILIEQLIQIRLDRLK